MIVEATQEVGNYYLRVGNGGGVCDGPNAQAAAGETRGAIVSYEGAGDATPTSTPVTLTQNCEDFDDWEPYISTPVPAG